MKFCFVCGKKTDKLVEGYCEECYSNKFELLKVPEEVTVKMCSRCGRIKYRNVWREMEVEDVLKDKVKILGKDVSLRIEKNEKIHVFAKGFLKDSKKLKREEHEIRLKINKVVCPSCSRRSGGYYEAILQLRGDVDKAMDFLDDQLANEKSVYRIERAKNGIDIYLDSTHLANSLSHLLKKRFKARVRKTYRLFTRKEGKDIYRSTIVVRI